MLDITIIVPLKKLGKAEEKYLNTALKSITEIKGKESLSLMFVGPKKVIEKALEKAEAIFKTTEIAIQCDLIVNDDTNIFEQINSPLDIFFISLILQIYIIPCIKVLNTFRIFATHILTCIIWWRS